MLITYGDLKGLIRKKLTERKLTSKVRDSLPDDDFVFPKERKYPIHDKSHARNALARVSQHGTPSEKSRVKSRVRTKFPSIEVND